MSLFSSANRLKEITNQSRRQKLADKLSEAASLGQSMLVIEQSLLTSATIQELVELGYNVRESFDLGTTCIRW